MFSNCSLLWISTLFLFLDESYIKIGNNENIGSDVDDDDDDDDSDGDDDIDDCRRD